MVSEMLYCVPKFVRQRPMSCLSKGSFSPDISRSSSIPARRAFPMFARSRNESRYLKAHVSSDGKRVVVG